MLSGIMNRLNERRDAAQEAGEDAGFTLIELMVVLLILAILLAIAIPTFLGVTKSANDRAAQSNLNTALTNAKSVFEQQSQSYPTTAGSMVADLTAAEKNLSFVSDTVSSTMSPATISVAVATDGQGVALAEQAKGTGNCWIVIDNASTETWTATTTDPQNGAGTWYGVVNSKTACNASAVAGGAASYQASSFPAAP